MNFFYWLSLGLAAAWALLTLLMFVALTRAVWRTPIDLRVPQVIPPTELTEQELRMMDQAVLELSYAAPGWKPVALLKNSGAGFVIACDGRTVAAGVTNVVPTTGQVHFSGLLLTTLTSDGRRIVSHSTPRYFHPLSDRVPLPPGVEGYTVTGWSAAELLRLHDAQVQDAQTGGRTVVPFTDPLAWSLSDWGFGNRICAAPYGWVDKHGFGHLHLRTAMGSVARRNAWVCRYRGARANREALRYLASRQPGPTRQTVR